ncbi:hypothetical protein scyTo_0019702 [Scyliorhinus torazame]|uniref:Uncharacterized protein n=1 Tax=Scyliorhinus torazame TaxID=75743 RepID=A0A401PPF9_SCYTO|nr:hypothetical protein [Scyliorhinus torazame]
MKEPRSRKDNRRPDIQIYQPGISRLRNNRQKGPQLESSGKEETDEKDLGGNKEVQCQPVPKRSGTLATEGHSNGSNNQGYGNRNGQLNRNEEEDVKWADEQIVMSSNSNAVGKQSKRIKKPDRQIYQPGRRVQVLNKESVSSLDNEELVNRVEELRLVDESKNARAEEENAETGEGKGSLRDREKIQPIIEVKLGKREKGRRGERKDAADQRNNSAKEPEDAQIIRSQARPEKAGGPSKRYSRSDKRRGRNRTCSTSSAGSNNSLDGPPSQHGPPDGERRKIGVKERKMAAERKEKLRPCKQVSISSTDSLEDDCAEENRNYAPVKSPEKTKGFKKEWPLGRNTEGSDCWNRESKSSLNETSSRVAITTKQNSEERNKGRGKPCRAEAKSTLSASKLSHKTEKREKVEEPRGKSRGILVLPANTDLSSTAPGSPDSPQMGTRLLFGRSSRMRGRGGTSRRLWDPNNPDQKPALKSQTAQLHFLDTDDECSSSSQGETYSYTHPAPTAYYKFQNSDNPYGYSRATVPGPQYPYGPYAMPYQMSGNSNIYPATYYPGFPTPQFLAPFQAGQLNPEDMEQHVRTLQQQELGKLLRMADNQELQLSNLLSRDNISKDGLERMAQLR